MSERIAKRFADRPVSRRDFLAGAVGLAVIGFFNDGKLVPSHNRPNEQGDGSPLEPLHENAREKFPPVFQNEQAQACADEMHITPGAYFKLTKEAVGSVTRSGRFATESELVPIFPPAVREHQDIIEWAARRNDIPPNVFAALATIESCGDTDAVSEADAWGLVQVVPQFHLQRYVDYGYLPETATYEDYQEAKLTGDEARLKRYTDVFRDPEATTLVGAEFFAECINKARAENKEMDPDSLIIYARAAAMYNGGSRNAGADYADMPLESQLYVNHVSRILLDVEMAAVLREQGMSDRQVLGVLQSEEMNARAYAYANIPRDATIESYERSAEKLRDPSSDQKVEKDYNDYLAGRAYVEGSDTGKYTIPLTPSIRIWAAGGGISLLARSPENVNWRVGQEADS